MNSWRSLPCAERNPLRSSSNRCRLKARFGRPAGFSLGMMEIEQDLGILQHDEDHAGGVKRKLDADREQLRDR